MQNLCPFNSPCVDDQSSLGNFTSEAPDELLFKGIHYRNSVWDGDDVYGDSRFNACHGLCTSSVSQEDADLCASLNAGVCLAGKQVTNTAQTYMAQCSTGVVQSYTVPAGTFMAYSLAEANAQAYQFAYNAVTLICAGATPPSLPVTFSPSQRKTNQAQECSVDCFDGSSWFTWVVPAGMFSGSSQAAADAMATSWACKQANKYVACLTSLPSLCVGSIVNDAVMLFGAGPAPLSWVVTGTTPPGLTITFADEFATFTGVPTTGGAYYFRLTVTDGLGNYTYRDYSVLVMEITTPAALPDGSTGTAYSEFITVAPGSYVAPLSFQLEAGSTLPDGLLLDETTGEISGTPTTDGDYTFTIVVQDAAT